MFSPEQKKARLNLRNVMMAKNNEIILDQENDVENQITPVTHAIQRQTTRLPTERKTAKQIASQVRLIQSVMREVMRADEHYGIIPGTKKNTLYKAGSEVLLTTFMISVQPEIHDLSDADCVKYRVLAHGIHQTTGITMGIGVGECSTNEEKYKWRVAVCDEEYEDTPDDRRRIKYKQWGNNPVERIRQIRTEPADLANTVLKMAKKRAQIDLTLTATGASDIFTQDIDGDGNLVTKPEAPQAARKPTSGGNGKKATDKQVAFLSKKLDESSKDIEDLKEHFNVDGFADLTMDQVNDVLEWLK